VRRARDVAFEIVDADPTLGDHPVLASEVRLLLHDDDETDTEFLLKS
jgi:hypothetical protein